MASQRVDVVRPDGRPRELLDEEVLLHRQPRGGEEADRVRPVLGLHAQEPVGCDLVGVLPGRRVQLAVLAADKGVREPVRVVDEVEREPALDAEVALVRDVVRLGGDLHDPLRLGVDVQVDLAADAAERARRLHLLEPALGPVCRLFELLVDRSGRADGEAAAAELALGVEPRVAVRRDDARVRAPPFERERRALHDLLRVANAAVAEDARVRVVAHQLVAVGVGLALRVGEDERRLRVELSCEVDQLVGPAARIRVQVLGEQHLGQRLAELRHGGVGRNGHALGDAGGAGGQRSRRALDPDDAHAAAAVRLQLVVVAERRDEDAVPRGGVDEQLALGRAGGLSVERELNRPGHGVNRNARPLRSPA